MKRYILVCMVGLLSISCNGQDDGQKTDTKESDGHLVEQPKGTWSVHKEFDEHGNLIQYDSIYSWSSNSKFDTLSASDKDSVMQSFKSRLYKNYSGFENDGFEAVFSQDSLFSKQFFNEDVFGSNFGNDFMDIDKLRQQMMARQKAFLETYQSEFIKPEDEN